MAPHTLGPPGRGDGADRLPMYGVLRSSALPWCYDTLSAMAHIHPHQIRICCLRYVTGRWSDNSFLPSPLYRERRSLYEAHQTVLGHHGSNTVGGKRGGSDVWRRLRLRAKLGS